MAKADANLRDFQEFYDALATEGGRALRLEVPAAEVEDAASRLRQRFARRIAAPRGQGQKDQRPHTDALGGF